MRKLVAVLFVPILVLGLTLADRLALRSIPSAPTEPDRAGFTSEQALGRVLTVRPRQPDEGSGARRLKGMPYAWQLVACQLLSGRFTGRVVLCNQLIHPNPSRNIVVREGDCAVIELAARAKTITWVQLRKPALRYRSLLWLLGALFLGLLAFGGWRSARNTLGVAGIIALMVAAFFPLLGAGAPPLDAMARFSALTVGGVLLLFYGWDRKALAALAGTIGALLCVVLVSAAASRGLKLTGLETAGSRYLIELKQHAGIEFDYHGLLLAGLLVAVVGVAIDTSVSIAAGIEELYRTHPGIERRRAFASGLAIGRDVMGVCATTFVFASIGVRLPVLLCPAAVGLTPAELVNTEAGCVEVVRILACGIGLLAAAPLTALAAIAIFSRWGVEKPWPRSPRRWVAAALIAEVVAIIGLSVAIARHPPHAAPPPPRFVSLEKGTFEAVVDEANELLEEFDYPRAILLLWEAQERGIARLPIHLRLPRLYLDHLAYIHYYERKGLPEEVQKQWARTTAIGASRTWNLHAIADLRAVLDEEPDNFAAHFNLGRLLCTQGDAANAIPHFQAALKTDPDNVELLCDLAAAYTMFGETKMAELVARRLERLAPDHPRVQQLLDRLRPPPPPTGEGEAPAEP